MPAVADARGLHIHEWAFLTLGLGTTLTLAAGAGASNHVTIEAATATLIYAGLLVALLQRHDVLSQKGRMVLGFGFALWAYGATARIVPALGLALHDTRLNAADEAMFGTTPSVLCQGWTTSGLTDLMSACYLSYHFYLGAAFLHALWLPLEAGRRFAGYAYAGFATGLPIYLLVPAMGPVHAFPAAFTVPLTGGPITQLNATIVANGSSIYDVFPSLHVLVTCLLLAHDWSHLRSRFLVMLLPTVGLFVSTIYLRYHYAIDLIAGFALFGALMGARLIVRSRGTSGHC